jgi:AMMECR1 domain-containing protein
MIVFALTAVLTLRQAMIEPDTKLILLARAAVQAEVLHKSIPRPTAHSPAHAVFVTIERNGRVLGCRGDLTPRLGSLEEEVVSAARAAAANDPRYRPLKSTDLDGFLVTVTIVSGTEKIQDVESLRPSEGLVLESGGKKGIVLPWEGKDPFVRLLWAYRKAGVPEGSSATLYRLIAARFRG